jgi:POT family proton-dependent oligopeptide transporter
MSKDTDRAFFGHPAGLSTLFFTEMWERLSYYGMRAFLILYMTAPAAIGGRGMGEGAAGGIVALYTASVYLLSLPGGWIADRFLGQRRAVLFGGMGIATGSILLALPVDGAFFPGLVCGAIGTGLLKPNISTIVGQLYKPEDIRRDSGYTIYYMGINIGALIAPFVCGFLAESPTFRGFLLDRGIDPKWCWKFAFAIPAVGMIAGLVQYVLGSRRLGDAGLHPTIPSDAAKAARDRLVLKVIVGAFGALAVAGLVMALIGGYELDEDIIDYVFGFGLVVAAIALFVGLYTKARDDKERRGVLAMIPLFIGCVAFFGIFEQASSTLNLFAKQKVAREWLGMTLQASYWQGANPLFILIVAPFFAALWLRLARRNKEPSSVTKFGIGMVLVAVSFVVMLPSLGDVDAGRPISASYLAALYLVYTCAELCISPVGLSTFSKLAPPRLAGMVMGTWFLGTSIGNFIAGNAAKLSASRGYPFLFKALIVAALVTSAALFVVAPMVKRMMAGEKAELPVAKVEPSPEKPAA